MGNRATRRQDRFKEREQDRARKQRQVREQLLDRTRARDLKLLRMRKPFQQRVAPREPAREPERPWELEQEQAFKRIRQRALKLTLEREREPERVPEPEPERERIREPEPEPEQMLERERIRQRAPEQERMKHPGAGHGLLSAAECLFNRETCTIVFEPIIRDLQDEMNEALDAGHCWHARYVQARGYYAFWTAVILQSANTLIRKLGGSSG